MKTILTLGVGFWLGRQLYINFDKEQTIQKEAQIKKRLIAFLEANDFTNTESRKESTIIIGV